MGRVVLVLLLAAGAVAAKDKGPERYEFPDGRYSVVFPKKPEHDTKTIRSAAGEQTLDIRVCSGGTDLSLSVTYTDYPPKYQDADPAKLLAAVRDGMKTKDARLVPDAPPVPPGELPPDTPTLAFTYDHGKYLARTRLALVGRRLYQVTAIGPKDGVYGKAAEAFLMSFRASR